MQIDHEVVRLAAVLHITTKELVHAFRAVGYTATRQATTRLRAQDASVVYSAILYLEAHRTTLVETTLLAALRPLYRRLSARRGH